MKTRLFLAVLMMLVSQPLLASSSVELEQFPQQMTARDLLLACSSSSLTGSGRSKRRFCAGFVSGVEEGARILKERNALPKTVCLAEGVSAKALAATYTRFAGKKGRDLNQPAAAVVLEALATEYPCE